MRRLVAGSLLLLLMFSGVKELSDCAGWQSSAAARMACCEKANDNCPRSQMAADACCARSEQAKQPSSVVAASTDAGVPVLYAVPMLFAAVTDGPLTPSSTFIDGTRSDPPGSPPTTHSILRI
jgi:hypothetical protein